MKQKTTLWRDLRELEGTGATASTQPSMAALWFLLGHDLREKLQQSAAKNDRFLIEEIEFRLRRDLEHESLGPRRSVRIRQRRINAPDRPRRAAKASAKQEYSPCPYCGGNEARCNHDPVSDNCSEMLRQQIAEAQP